MTGLDGIKTMMKSLVIAASFLLLAACGDSSMSGADNSAGSASGETASSDVSSSGGNWKIIPELSRLTFTTMHAGDTFTGDFKRFSATIQLDPDDLSNAHVEVIVDMSSVDAKDELRNQSLPGADWFDVSQFPTAVFKSDSITKVADGMYQAAGQLTVRDVTKDVVLPFTLDIDGDTGRAFGELKLMRKDYNVGIGSQDVESDQWVAYEVTVTFDITATRIGS